jgi:hypothetical protein
MELAIQKFTIICYLVIGLSHIFQHRAWAEFFIRLREKGETGNFLNAFLHLPMGAMIVAFHNVWSGIPMVLTIIGWSYCVKSLIYFVYPKHGLRMLARVKVEKSREFIAPGALIVVYACLLAYSIYGK